MKEYRIYKPNTVGTGAASTWNVKFTNGRKSHACVFLEMAKQIPSEGENAKFDWENCLRIKLEAVDVGELLAVLYHDVEAINNGKGLFHQNDKGNVTLNFGVADRGYFLRMGRKRDGQVSEVKHGVTFGEAAILRKLLEHSLDCMFQWNPDSNLSFAEEN